VNHHDRANSFFHQTPLNGEVGLDYHAALGDAAVKVIMARGQDILLQVQADFNDDIIIA
jgi:hypothetical protein